MITEQKIGFPIFNFCSLYKLCLPHNIEQGRRKRVGRVGQMSRALQLKIRMSKIHIGSK